MWKRIHQLVARRKEIDFREEEPIEAGRKMFKAVGAEKWSYGMTQLPMNQVEETPSTEKTSISKEERMVGESVEI